MKHKIKPEIKHHSRDEISDAAYSPRCSLIRVDHDAMRLYIRKSVFALHEGEWAEINLGMARLPGTKLWPKVTKFSDHSEYFYTVVATVDAYLLRQKSSKSSHKIAALIVANLVKLIEFSVINGFYRLNDIPGETWRQLRLDLSTGGWVKALDIERRAVAQIAKTLDRDWFTSRNGKESIRTEFLELLGTNITTKEINSIRCLLDQARSSKALAIGGELASYERAQPLKLTASSLNQILATINHLADAPAPWGTDSLPIVDAHAFAAKFGRPKGRTENIHPDVLAKALTHSYKWVLEYGPNIASLVESLAFHISANYELLENAGPNVQLTRPQCNQLNLRLLSEVPEREVLEAQLGKKIISFRLRESNESTTSVNDILNEFHSACFCVLAVMNARRKDEISHPAIGLHKNSFRVLDQALGIYECDFYVEKSSRDYIPFLVNDITKTVIDLLIRISTVAWEWSGSKDTNLSHDQFDKMQKLFVSPKFSPTQDQGVFWFSFDTNPAGRSNGFLLHLKGNDKADIRLTPHMFRRAYGTVYHYRFENADLIALSQKYGHLDVLTTRTYVTDGLETLVGKTLNALWSAPGEVITNARRQHHIDLEKEVSEAGELRLRSFIEDVVVSSKPFGGGFVRLVNRFHHRLGARLDYSALSPFKQAQALSDALIKRGHVTEPLTHATCMSGNVRRGAACSSADGAVRRQLAAPETCSGCPYSVVALGHLLALKHEEAILSAQCSLPKSTIYSHQQQMSLQAIRRVIALQSGRLGVQ